jgi:hypothetical protein
LLNLVRTAQNVAEAVDEDVMALITVSLSIKNSESLT